MTGRLRNLLTMVVMAHVLAAPVRALQPPGGTATPTEPLPTPTPSQTSDACADPDRNGLITVTDGVLALRAAADLPSPCTDLTCDVDGSGTFSISDGVRILQRAAGFFTAYQCPVEHEQLDGSAFRSFRLTRQPAFGFCPPLGSVFAVSIERSEIGGYRFAASVTIDLPEGDPACFDFSYAGEGRCLSAVDLPERRLSAAEVAHLAAAFETVDVALARDPFCAIGAIDPCAINRFEWDDTAVDDYPCGAPRLAYEEGYRLTQALNELIVESTTAP